MQELAQIRELSAGYEFIRLQNVELEEVVRSSVLDRVERQLVGEVELSARWLILQNLPLHLHRKESISLVENRTAHYDNAHVNCGNVPHHKFNNLTIIISLFYRFNN